MLTTNLNLFWADLLISELVRCGVDAFHGSSGARSAPLALALANQTAIQPVIHFDERASAFHALGHARATGRPAVWFTTSGSAVANGWPAVVEAHQDGVPLILLTADRPPEWRDTRANQTIEQTGIFGSCTRWSVDLPCPDTRIPAAFVLTTVDQAVARAQNGFGGPVHINGMFREPLGGEAEPFDATTYLAPLAQWIDSDQPFTRIGHGPVRPAVDDVLPVIERVQSAQRGVIVAGRLPQTADQQAVMRWATELDWPVWPDILSGARLGANDPRVCPHIDLLLLTPDAGPAPDVIIHLGGPLVSKRVQTYIDRSDAWYVVIRPHPHRQDYAHRVNYALQCAPTAWLEAWRDATANQTQPVGLGWGAAWKSAHDAARRICAAHAADAAAWDEAVIAATLSRRLPPTYALFLGNSMPVRDMDQYGVADGAATPVMANRGASGIDGTVSTASGWAAGLQRPVAVVLGDLAFLHDLNALHYVRRSGVPLLVCVINNNGGGIFSFLPMRDEASFETFFGTPHGYTAQQAAAMFDLPYTAARSAGQLETALQAATAQPASGIIECFTERSANYEAHRELQERIGAAVREASA